MSDTTAEGAATVTEESGQQQEQQETKPTETVEFWKGIAREQEKRAKENASAAKRLAEIEEAQKSDEQKRVEREAAMQAEVDSIPSKVSAALRDHLVELHGIEADDAELFLTASEPELLLKQVTRLLGQSGKSKSNRAPREGNNPPAETSDMREFARQLFKTNE